VSKKAIEARRAGFQKYKKDVQERGKPFYPFAMFHDTVMSLVVVVVIVGLAVIWKYTAGDHPDQSGVLGPLFKGKADPGTTSFVPRPDWYFYFLFYLLRIFKWPESVILGTVGIPTIALVLLLALPFIDTRRERRLSRRPVAVVAAILTVIAMGALTYKGATASEALGSELAGQVPTWVKKEHLPPQAVPGAKLFAVAGCLNCHSYLGVGGGFAGAPDLTAIGTRHLGIAFQIKHLKCPSCVTPGSPMPPFAALGDANLKKLAIFLEASQGPK
jgi:menaquinol-cytochrome c reductase cytochrome b/c subunit